MIEARYTEPRNPFRSRVGDLYPQVSVSFPTLGISIKDSSIARNLVKTPKDIAPAPANPAHLLKGAGAAMPARPRMGAQRPRLSLTETLNREPCGAQIGSSGNRKLAAIRTDIIGARQIPPTTSSPGSSPM
jgi:hypothetical protein